MYRFCLILLIAISCGCNSIEIGENVPGYLVNRLAETKSRIAREFMQRDNEPVIPFPYDIDWVKLWSENLHSERTLMIDMYNKMCLLEGNRLISVAVKPATNETNSALKQVTMIKYHRSVKFVKSIYWKSELYLLTCYEDDNACELYIATKDFHLRHIQTIKNNESPVMMDATFFSQTDRLYLVVVHETDQFSVSSVIYRWTETYMDVIYRITIVGAISVTAFNYKQSTIIIFGRNDKREPDIGSSIYKLHDNGIEIIQYLPTNRPVSIHHYNDTNEIFLVVVNEIGPSRVYWWDGNGFLPVFDIPYIVAESIVRVVHFNDETLFFVSYKSTVTLYKVSSSKYQRLLEFKRGERVVDMGVWIDDNATLTLLLITVDPSNLYRIEPWKFNIQRNETKARLKMTSEDCLSELETRLYERVATVKNAVRHNWPLLLPSTKDKNIEAPLKFKKLILQSGSIGNIEILSSKEILTTTEMKRELARSSANSVLDESRNILKTRESNRLFGNVVVTGNATFNGLRTNEIYTNNLNERSFDISNSAISRIKNQAFANAQLVGKNITVRNLKIDQLCGIPFDYWLRDSNKVSNNIFLRNETLRIINDTIFIKTNLLSFDRLNLETINSVMLDSFFDNLFILGQRQLIKGNIIQRDRKNVMIGDLSIEQLNGVDWNDLMTVNTNQSLKNNVFARNMSVSYLQVKKINGIPVSESAMVSKKNHLKGQVTIPRLIITNELTSENPSKFVEFRPVHVYDDVTIKGSVNAENVIFESNASLVLSLRNESTIELSNIDSILDSFWTRSTNQIIENKIRFDNGLTVDRLTLRYFNDLSLNSDIMFTDVIRINEDFGSIEFANFTANRWIVGSSKKSGLWNVTKDRLNINEKLRIEYLGGKNLTIGSFNGIPISEIIKRITSEIIVPYEYPEDSIVRFDTIVVNDLLRTKNLDFQIFNDQNNRLPRNFLQSDVNNEIRYIETDSLTVRNIAFVHETDVISELRKFFDYVRQWNLNLIKRISSLTIDGNLFVKKNLQTVTINEKSTITYLEELISQDFSVFSNDTTTIDNFVVHGNIIGNLIENTKIESLIVNTLSKYQTQNFTNTKLDLFKISVDDLITERINERPTSNFVYTDYQNLNINGDLTFTNLKLSLNDGDHWTKSLNGHPIDTLYTRLGQISQKQINDLTVIGNVSWISHDDSLAMEEFESGQLETIINRSLVKNSQRSQLINGPIALNTASETSPGIFVRSMKYDRRSSAITQNHSWITEMTRIVDDTVLDDPTNVEGIKIDGEKSFGKSLKASRVNVAGEIGIESVNAWKVNDLNESVVRKESLMMSSLSNGQRVSRQNHRPGNDTIVFRENVIIKKLVIETDEFVSEESLSIHGVPISEIVSVTTTDSSKYLTNNTYFDHLKIEGNAIVKSLDNVDFNEFVDDRVTLRSNHQVRANLKFNGRVQVYQGTEIRTINGIEPFDFVINDSNDDNIISGEKTFHDDIEINGDTYAPWISGIDFKAEHDNGVLNDQDIEIIGDINFKAAIARPPDGTQPTTRWEFNPVDKGSINGMKLKSFLKDRQFKEERIFEEFAKNESLLNALMTRGSTTRKEHSGILNYLESQNDLTIGLSGIDRVRILKIEETTILNMYSNQLGINCGLTNDCPCRRQHVAEITTTNDFHYRDIEGSAIVYNYQQSNGAYDVTVATTSVSTSERCTVNGDDKSYVEYTTISWTKPAGTSDDDYSRINFTDDDIKIYGYLSDVQFFTHNELVFIVLAIYWDPIKQSHETDSLIYALNVETDRIHLAQVVPTIRASGVHVFQTSILGTHLLFTSSGIDDFGRKSMSVLRRFEPSTAKFELLRIFVTSGNAHAASVSLDEDEFIFLDDAATNSINVYAYNAQWDNFYPYQNLFHKSMAPITAIQTFYAGESRRTRAYVIVTIKHDRLIVYEYMFAGKFQTIAQIETKDILTTVPFDVSNRRYVFVGTETNSTILRLI